MTNRKARDFFLTVWVLFPAAPKFKDTNIYDFSEITISKTWRKTKTLQLH
jgi:hypothetical protein